MNSDVLSALRKALAACIAAATECETCKESENSDWASTSGILDECSDALRELEAEIEE